MKESGFRPYCGKKMGTFLTPAFLEHSFLNTSPEVYKLVTHCLKNMIMHDKFKNKLVCIQNGFIEVQIRSN